MLFLREHNIAPGGTWDTAKRNTLHNAAGSTPSGVFTPAPWTTSPTLGAPSGAAVERAQVRQLSIAAVN